MSVHPRAPECEVEGAGDVRGGEAARRRGRVREGDGADGHRVLAGVVSVQVGEAGPEPVGERNRRAGVEIHGRVLSPLVEGEGDPAAVVGAAQGRAADLLREVQGAGAPRVEAEEGGRNGGREEEPGELARRGVEATRGGAPQLADGREVDAVG